ncbi:MAG: carboxypeptidase regulatory-like domain-containing protein, partial [Planctomycetes bacterium]|nr:carboxypeptidase regulatory-like domain-containing protein [Planctomycetota bacterium]
MKIKLLIVAVLLLFSVGGACAAEDTVERYTVDYTDYWTVGGVKGDAAVVQMPTLYPTSNTLRFDHVTTVGGTAWITFNELISPDYIRFTVRDITTYNNNPAAFYQQYVSYYDSDGVLIFESVLLRDQFWDNKENDTFELIKIGNDIHLYINGVQNTTIGSTTEDEIYFEFNYHPTNTKLTSLYFDDFATSSVLGMDEHWTQTSTYIDVSYGVQSMFSFPSSTYTVESKQVSTGTVIDTTTIPSNQGAGDKPAGFVRWNRNEIYGTNWGLYHVQLFRDTTKLAETTFTYFDSTISGSVSFDQDSYSQGQTANIAYTISSPDFSTYTYYLKTMDVTGTVEDTYTLTAASGTKSPSLTDYDSGIYYAILSRTNKATGVNEEFAYDYASVTETVYVVGNVTEAVSGLKMPNASIQYLQGVTYYNTTSADDGSYNVSDLSVSVSTTITANATYINDANFGTNNYSLSSFSFTPLAAEIYNIDLILFDVNHTYNNASVYGLVHDNIYNQPIYNSTVNIYNDTWSDSTTSTATGYYVFNGLLRNGTYNVNATANGYTDSINYEINTTTSNATRQDIPLSTLYTVTIKATDATTTAYLSDFTATLDGVEGTAVNGTVTFNNIEYGLHAISAIADDYYPSATTPLIDEDTEVILDLTRLQSEYYAPHQVKFIVKSWYGTKYSGVATVVYIGDEASGDSYLTGTTGTDGAVVFELSEDVQYTITFIDATQSINEDRTLYPVEDKYSVIVFGANLIPDTPDTNNILFGCYGASINLTHGYINVSFNDTSVTTTLAELWINDTDMTNLYYFNTTDDAKSWSQVVTGGNASYVIVFKLTNTELSEPLIITRYIQFDDAVRVNLGLDEGWKYQLIAVVIISVIALLGSALNAEKMAVITVLVGWLMVFFGWLQAG